jgi:hypothetical protein
LKIAHELKGSECFRAGIWKPPRRIWRCWRNRFEMVEKKQKKRQDC